MSGLDGAINRVANVPNNPKIYHITHVDNLPQLLQMGMLFSDAERIRQGLNCQLVGISRIKDRRRTEIEVDCHAGTKVGEYVPFYFCPRSIMLYLLHKGNHPDISYRDGQRPIVHLQSDLLAVVRWASSVDRKWAFSRSNAGSRYTEFYADLARLDQVNWEAVESSDFRDSVIKDGKQAEFLLHESFPLNLVEKIGVMEASIGRQVQDIYSGSSILPTVSIEREWYY
jgi:hypothetical protein